MLLQQPLADIDYLECVDRHTLIFDCIHIITSSGLSPAFSSPLHHHPVRSCDTVSHLQDCNALSVLQILTSGLQPLTPYCNTFRVLQKCRGEMVRTPL